MTDTEIIELFFERSDRAIAELEEAHGSAVRRVAMNILANPLDGEECINDTWFGVWNTIPPLRPSPLRTFVCRIARNLAIKKYHSNSACKRNSYYDLALDELSECVAAPNDLPHEVHTAQVAVCVEKFLGTLSDDDRRMFVRRYWHMESIAQIAARFGCSEGRVKSTLHRTRGKLHRYLEKEGRL